MEIDWAKHMDASGKLTANLPPGEGWFTFEEFQTKMEIGRNRAYKIVKKKLQAGEMESYRGSKYNPQLNQNTRRIWYRFIEPD